jgi:thymidylate synthase (FAD)
MNLLKPSFTVISDVEVSEVMTLIERAGRTCYKSETAITEDSSTAFVKNLIKRGHESVLEHVSITVKIVCDRGVSHEIVRHRIASYSQESTRYCNYAKGEGKGVSFIIPPWVEIKEGEYWNTSDLYEQNTGFSSSDEEWFVFMLVAETRYTNFINMFKWTPQQARAVLPNSLKTEIVVTMNLREWRHFFKLRTLGTAGTPHPQMSEITVPMLIAFEKLLPAVFGDLADMLYIKKEAH